jgi:competence protein ComEC
MRRIFPWIIALLVLAGILFLAQQAWALQPDGRFHAYFLDVGQGDSALLVTPSGKQVLIDGGPDGSALPALTRHLPLFDRSIDLLVLSHPHLDHLFDFPDVLRRYRVGAILCVCQPYASARYRETLDLLAAHHVPIVHPDPAHDLDLGDGVRLDVVWPGALSDRQAKDANNTSVVLRALYKGHAILFTGDMERKEEDAILRSGADVHADILKVPHHGSRTSSSTGMLLAVHPSLAVISVGTGNKYGHPNADVLERYRHLGIPVRRTDRNGETDVVW